MDHLHVRTMVLQEILVLQAIKHTPMGPLQRPELLYWVQVLRLRATSIETMVSGISACECGASPADSVVARSSREVFTAWPVCISDYACWEGDVLWSAYWSFRLSQWGCVGLGVVV